MCSKKKISIIDLLMEYDQTIRFLYLEHNKQTQMAELKDYCSMFSQQIKNTKTLYGNTRCFTSTSFVNQLLLHHNQQPIFTFSSGNKMLAPILLNILKAICNYFVIYIRPDHVYCIIKITVDGISKWYLISSWIYLYTLNVVEIDIDSFLNDLVYLYFENNPHPFSDKVFVERYELFLSKYMLYKTRCTNSSIYVVNNLNTVNSLVKHQLWSGVNFVSEGYYGDGGAHKLDFEAYIISEIYINLLLFSLLTNPLSAVSRIPNQKFQTGIKNNVRRWVYRTILSSGTVMGPLNPGTVSTKNFEFHVKNIIELLDIFIHDTEISLIFPRGKDNIICSQDYFDFRSQELDKLVLNYNITNTTCDQFTQSGGYFDRSISVLGSVKNNVLCEFLFYYWDVCNMINFDIYDHLYEKTSKCAAEPLKGHKQIVDMIPNSLRSLDGDKIIFMTAHTLPKPDKKDHKHNLYEGGVRGDSIPPLTINKALIFKFVASIKSKLQRDIYILVKFYDKHVELMDIDPSYVITAMSTTFNLVSDSHQRRFNNIIYDSMEIRRMNTVIESLYYSLLSEVNLKAQMYKRNTLSDPPFGTHDPFISDNLRSYEHVENFNSIDYRMIIAYKKKRLNDLINYGVGGGAHDFGQFVI